MKKRKSILSLFLALAMVLALMPAAFATDAPHDVDMGALQPDSWNNGGELSSIGSKITLNGVIGESTAMFQEHAYPCYDVVVGGGFTLDMNFPKECTREYSVMVDPVILNGDRMDVDLWPIPEDEGWIFFREEDHKSQYVFTGTEAMVNKPGNDMTIQFYVSWSEAPLGLDYGPSGEVSFILRFHPASETKNEIKNIAYASTQTVDVGGDLVEFQMYALKDENGNDTNYIKLRDLAFAIGQTQAGFEVGWNGAVNIDTTKTYTINGSEMSTPFSGNRPYEMVTEPTNVNGTPVNLNAFILKDDNGGAYTYYQLRDLGRVLGFNVGWSAERGIFVNPDEPYSGTN